MRHADLLSQSCSVSRVVAQVGDEWTLTILREMFPGTRRFDDFLRVTGMSSHFLSQRLKKMQAAGMIRPGAYREHPPCHDDILAQRDRDLWPVIVAFKHWGGTWLCDGEAPVRIVHKACGHASALHLVCSI